MVATTGGQSGRAPRAGTLATRNKDAGLTTTCGSEDRGAIALPGRVAAAG